MCRAPFVLLAGLVLLFSASAPARAAEPYQAPLVTDCPLTLKVDGVSREYYLHLPPTFDGTHPLPLVLLLHGAGGSPEGIYDYTRMGLLADQAGFVLACPAALGDPASWSVGFNTGMRDPSDVHFLALLIRTLVRGLNLDPGRVYIAGHSSGAMMAYRFAAERSELVTAIGVVAGTIGARDADGTMVQIPKPAHPVSVIAFHGSQDPLDPCTPADTWVYNRNFIPGNEAAAYWAGIDGCRPAIRTTQNGVVTDRYEGGKDGAEVVFHTILGGDHWWPGDRDDAPFIAPADQNADATALIGEFFLHHSRGAKG